MIGAPYAESTVDLDTWASLVEAAFASRRPENVAALYAEDGWRIEHARPGVELMGRPAVAARIEGWFAAVPDCVIRVTGVYGDDDVRILEWVFGGTHAATPAESEIRLGALPARGERVHLPGVSVCQMSGDLIALERCYFDAATLMAGAGVIP
ncbi:MAG: nuclear transport factor 2 family protein [Thermoleophilia bacterium]|nr:nuclear transport factor 2 family protein [Thermoleophilia bacterium]